MSNHKVKGLGVKLLIVGVEEGPKHNCGAYLDFFSLTTKSRDDNLKALFCSFYPFIFSILQLFVLCCLSITSLFSLCVSSTHTPLSEANESTDDYDKR